MSKKSMMLEFDQIKEKSQSDSETYVTFELAGQSYGINIGDAVEVIRLPSMAEPPEAFSYVIGLINLRGQVVPVFDMRLRLGLEPAKYTLATPILIVQLKKHTVGLLIDKVKEVITLPAKMIEPRADAFSSSHRVQGVAKVDAGMVFLLDLDALLSTSEATLLEDLFVAEKDKDKALV